MSQMSPEEIEDYINACEEMFHAAGHGRTERLRDALDRGANVNFIRSDQGIVMVALTKRSLECVQMLLEAGADPSQANRMGWAPLHEAASKNYEEMIPVLIQAGADPNRADLLGQTPLVMAIRGKSAEAAKALLEAGASVNSTDYDGMTPAMWAVHAELPGVLSDLVLAGADLDRTDAKGRTALDMAQASGWSQGLAILQQGRMLQSSKDKEPKGPATPAAAGLTSIKKIKMGR